MLTRMIVRLLFKAALSLGLLLGVVSYGHYLAGGDPGAIWSRVAGGALDGASDSLGGLRQRVGDVASILPSDAPDDAGDSRHDSVWTWRDANGVAHYASAPPAGVDATRVTVDPDTNVLAPVVLPAALRTPTRSAAPTTDGVPNAVPVTSGRGTGHGTTAGDARGAPAERESLPGIAGAILNARGDAPAPDPARAEALLRLLQPGAR